MRIIRQDRGFSLLEVLIAVVVLSVGLLALAALQGNMTRHSADAKVRGRVAAMLSARMDALRNGGYGNLSLGTPPPFVSNMTMDCNDGLNNDWLDCAREQAGLGSLQVSQTINVWYGAGGFASSTTEQDAALPQFKRITLTSTWTDAAGIPAQPVAHLRRELHDADQQHPGAAPIPPPPRPAARSCAPPVPRRQA
jgi:prepilin-type N-terminal cleavage/methylation domain-containing protein